MIVLNYCKMKFYLNENHLIESENDRSENLKEIRYMFKLLDKNGYKIYIKDNFNYMDLNTSPKYILPLSIFKYFQIIETNDCDFLNELHIEPFLDNYLFIELISLCNKHRNDKIVSISNEKEIIENEYRLNECNLEKIINIKGIDSLHNFITHNPVPKNIKETFDRIGNIFEYINFTELAYKTAETRDCMYKSFGYSKIINVFKIVNDLLYPFFKGEMEDTSEKDIIKKFKELTGGVEFSRESKATMNKYGHERNVTIYEEEVQMDYHIKILDNRIYFYFLESRNCIYIGHSGKHLSTINSKKN